MPTWFYIQLDLFELYSLHGRNFGLGTATGRPATIVGYLGNEMSWTDGREAGA